MQIVRNLGFYPVSYTHLDVYKRQLNNSIKEAATILSQNNIYGAPVEDNGNIVGTITLKDIGLSLIHI